MNWCIFLTFKNTCPHLPSSTQLIRVLANVSVHPRVGPLLARSRTCLGLLTSVLQHKGLAGSEELVLSALATLNNLTFYTRHQPVSVVHTDLAECEFMTLSCH